MSRRSASDVAVDIETIAPAQVAPRQAAPGQALSLGGLSSSGSVESSNLMSNDNVIAFAKGVLVDCGQPSGVGQSAVGKA